MSTHRHESPPLLTKSRRRCVIPGLKTLLLMEKLNNAIHFFVATRNVCPLAIPESFAHNLGLRLVKIHSLFIISGRFAHLEEMQIISSLTLVYTHSVILVI